MLLSSHGLDWVIVLYAGRGYVAVVLPALYQYTSGAHMGIPYFMISLYTIKIARVLMRYLHGLFSMHLVNFVNIIN